MTLFQSVRHPVKRYNTVSEMTNGRSISGNISYYMKEGKYNDIAEKHHESGMWRNR
ncbi:MAG: hypothetical protein ACQERJ_02045 [Bacillota bacterium]